MIARRLDCILSGTACTALQADAGACCDSCKSTAGCNAWVFCSQKGGCRAADGSVTKVGMWDVDKRGGDLWRLPAPQWV